MAMFGPLNWDKSRQLVWKLTKFKIEIPDAELRELEEMVVLHLERWAEKKLAESGEKKPAPEINRAINFNLRGGKSETDKDRSEDR